MDTITLPKNAAELTEAVNKAVGTAQEQVLSFNREAAAALAKLPNLVKLPKLPTWVPPFDTGVEGVDDVVEQVYEFRAERLEADRQFVRELLDVWTGVVSDDAPTATASRARTSRAKTAKA